MSHILKAQDVHCGFWAGHHARSAPAVQLRVPLCSSGGDFHQVEFRGYPCSKILKAFQVFCISGVSLEIVASHVHHTHATIYELCDTVMYIYNDVPGMSCVGFKIVGSIFCLYKAIYTNCLAFTSRFLQINLYKP